MSLTPDEQGARPHGARSEEFRDLGGGLVLRRARREDAEAVATFNARIHFSSGGPFEQREPNQGIAACTHDLMSGRHPSCDATDFTVVEDAHTGSVVSSTCLIPQKFSYEGVQFDAGLPEFVGTHPNYRRRGLVREQFEVLHRLSAERGHLMQAIAGIPYYYRRFSYEMAISLEARRKIYLQDIPTGNTSTTDEGQGTEGNDLFRLRLAQPSDAAFLSRLDRLAGERYLLTCPRDERLWHYELGGRDPHSDESLEVRIVEDSRGVPVGYLCHGRMLHRDALEVKGYELAPGISWLEANPVVLGVLKEIARERAGSRPPASLTFTLGEDHPLYEALTEPPLYGLDRRDHYSFYVRVPDVAAFIRKVAPVLERRLASSVAAGHTGGLKLSFFGDGLCLELEQGRLATVEPWEATDEDEPDAEFPDLTFLQLLFGYRSLEDLDYAFADCWAGKGDTPVLLKALFPRGPSDLRPVY